MVSPPDDTLTPETQERDAPEVEAVAEPTVADPMADGAERGAAGHDGPRNVPRPIGPERLRALRERIESGEYPSSDDVAGGLLEMFGRSE
ncbi:MAG: hypothetical protein QNJ98_06985 [Planctomycetota bacterium]|nr:hypothetical protein [Planctomycetota bacterium]